MSQATEQERLREWVSKEIQRHGPNLDRFVLAGHGANTRGIVAQALLSDWAPPEPVPQEEKKGKKGSKGLDLAPASPPAPAARLEIDREIASYLYPRAVAEAKTLRKSGAGGPYRFSILSYVLGDEISERWPILIELPDDGTSSLEADGPSGVVNGTLERLVVKSHDQILAGQRLLLDSFESVTKALQKENDTLRQREHETRDLWFTYQQKVLAIDADAEIRAKKERRTEDLLKMGKAGLDKFMELSILKARVDAGAAPSAAPGAGGSATAGLPSGPLPVAPGAPAPDLSGVSTEQLAQSLVQMAQMLDQQAKRMAKLEGLADLIQGFIPGAGPAKQE